MCSYCVQLLRAAGAVCSNSNCSNLRVAELRITPSVREKHSPQRVPAAVQGEAHTREQQAVCGAVQGEAHTCEQQNETRPAWGPAC